MTIRMVEVATQYQRSEVAWARAAPEAAEGNDKRSAD